MLYIFNSRFLAVQSLLDGAMTSELSLWVHNSIILVVPLTRHVLLLALKDYTLVCVSGPRRRFRHVHDFYGACITRTSVFLQDIAGAGRVNEDV